MDFIKRTFPLLLAIFLLSVLIRLPQINRPLSKHHEFCTAITLRITQIWYDQGADNFRWNPVMTYSHDADKFINNSANASGRMVDANGNYYYVSHPPFAYYFPYVLFAFLKIRPDILPIQILNLGFHFISGLFIYFIVCLLSFNRARNLPYRPAVVAFVVYLFLPVTLWFQGNVYMSDMAVHLLFVIGVYIVLKMIIRQKFYTLKYIFFYAVVLGLMVYTSWLGVFFAIGVLVYSLLHVRDIKGFRILIVTTVLVTLVVLRLIAYQYAQINGIGAYLSEMLNRYVIRGSLADTNQGWFYFMFSYLWMVKTIMYNYLIHYNIVYIVIALFVWLSLKVKKMKIIFTPNGYRFIWLSVMPILLLHAFFLNYSVHDFTVLYASLFFSVLLGILYDKVKKSGAVKLRTMQAGLVIVVLLMVAEFYVMNPPAFISEKKKEEYFFAKTIGEQINKESKPSEMVFSSLQEISPQIVFYAQRNIKQVSSTEEAMVFMKERKHTQGRLFYFEEKGANQDLKSMPITITL